MPIAKVQMSDGRIGRFEVPEGTTPDQVIAFVESMDKEKQSVRTQPPDKKVPAWGIENPNLYGAYGAGKALLEEAVRPAVETASAIGGAIAGTPLVGGSLGYGAGKKTMDIVERAYGELGDEDIEYPTTLEELKGSAVDVGSTLAIGKGFELGGKALSSTGKYLFDDLPDRLYASAVKMPLSKKWIKALPGKEVSMRKSATLEGLKERVPPSEFGAKKAASLEKEARTYVDKATSVLDQDPKNLIGVEESLNRGLKRAYAKAKTSSDPIGAKQTVDDISEKFRAHGDTLTPSKANQIKRDLYQEVKWGINDPIPLNPKIVESAKKGIANDIKISLEKLYPELKSLNTTDSSRIFLKEAIERGSSREMNSNIGKLGSKVLLASKAWPLSIMDATIGHPQIKARLAFALARANPSKYSKFVYPEMPAGYKPTPKEIKVGVYRYSPEFKPSKSPLPKRLVTDIQPGEPPTKIRNQFDVAKEKFEKERLKYLESKFKELEKIKANKGTPLSKPSKKLFKTPQPQSVEQRLKNL